MSSKKKSTKKPAAPKAAETEINTQSMNFWRKLASLVIPQEEDEEKVGEVAVTFRLLSALLRDNWKDIDRIANKASGLALSVSVKSKRENDPPTVAVGVSFSEKHSPKAESEIPEAGQDELPGMVMGDGAEDKKDESEEPARVHSAESTVEKV